MVQNLHFQTGAEILGEWGPREGATWSIPEGELFFLCTWSGVRRDFGWFGIYHGTLAPLESRAEELANWITGELSDHQGSWEQFGDLSKISPGWGLVVTSDEGLQLWRDPVGRLPLFWMRDSEGFEWATRPRVLSSFSLKPARGRLEKFLIRQNDIGRDDFWEGVNRLLPGERLSTWGNGRPRFVTWWPAADSFRFSDAELGQLSDAELGQRIGDLLVESVERVIERGISPVAHSGGIDSSLLLVLMAELEGDPFPVSMVDPSTQVFDESDEICMIRETLGIEGETFNIGGPMAWETPKVHHQYSDLGPASVPNAAYKTPFLERVKEVHPEDDAPAVVNGLGADRLLKGARQQYFWSAVGNRDQWLELARVYSPKKLLQGALREVGFAAVPARFPPSAIPPWLCHDTPRADLRYKPLLDEQDIITRRARYFRTWSWEYVTRSLERRRRATGILTVCPYLCPSLVRFSQRLSPAQLRTAMFSKSELRRLLVERLPWHIWKRDKSGLFNEVIDRGMLTYLDPTVRQILKNSYLEKKGFIKTALLLKELRRFEDEEFPDISPFRHEIWRVVAVELWWRNEAQL